MLQSKMLIPHPQTRILSLGKQIYCNGENMCEEQDLPTIKAWQILAGRKQLKAKNLKNLENSTLFEAYLAGWLIFHD